MPSVCVAAAQASDAPVALGAVRTNVGVGWYDGVTVGAFGGEVRGVELAVSSERSAAVLDATNRVLLVRQVVPSPVLEPTQTSFHRGAGSDRGEGC
jgi:hypothetical protein